MFLAALGSIKVPAVFVNGLSVWCADSKIYSAQISILDISSSKPSYAGMHFPWNGLLESLLYSPPLPSLTEKGVHEMVTVERVLLGSGTSVLQNPVHILLEEWRCREGKGENTENNLWQEIHQVDRKYTKDFSTSLLSLCSALWAEPAPPHPQICLQTLYFKTDMDTVYKKYAAKALPRPRSPSVIDKTELECLVWVLFMIIILTW